MSDNIKPHKIYSCWTGTIYQTGLHYQIKARAMFDHHEEMPRLISIESPNIHACVIDIKQKIKQLGGSYLTALFYYYESTAIDE